MLCERYNHFKTNIFSSNLVSYSNSQLFDVAGRTESPYAEDTLFVVSPIVNKVKTGNLSFILSADRIIKNVGNFQNISIDFGTGSGFETVVIGQPISKLLPSGMNRPVLRVQTNDGRMLKCRFEVEVPPVVNVPTSALNGGLDEVYDENNSRSETISDTRPQDGTKLIIAEVTTFFACVDGKLRKPLIILDGFNSGDSASVNNDGVTTQGFLKFFNGFKNTPISLSNDRAVTKDLRLEGYDLIFVNWKSESGRDDLRRNAFLLRKILSNINTEKAINKSIEKNVIIGLSMGGPIAKFCLLDLEASNPMLTNGGHDVKLFITYDSPMQGANIPLGFQFLIKDLGEGILSGLLGRNVSALKGGITTLKSPAAKQLLIYQAFESDPKNPVEFVSFYNELNAKGSLQKCDYKTVSNGSLIGTPNFPSPVGKQLLSGQFFLAPAVVVGAFLKLDVRTLPPMSSTSELIYKRTLLVRISILGVSQFLPIVPNFTATIQNMRPLDGAPGGTTALVKALDGKIPGMTSGRYNDGNQELINTTFIPTVSALDIRDPERNNPFFDIISEQNLITNQLVKSTGIAGSRGSTQFDVAVDIDNGANRIENQVHVGLSFRTTGFLLYELITKDALRTSGNVFLNNRTYNFGKNALNFPVTPPSPGNFQPRATSNVIDYTLTVENTGQLWVNRNGKIGFMDDINAPTNALLTDYALIIRKAEGCKSTTDVAEGIVNVRNSGIIRVADGTINNQASIRIRNGGTLRIQNGGTLIIERSNASVTIESGGKLIIESNGLVSLMSLGTKIVVKYGGQLILNGGALVNLAAFSSAIIVEFGGELIVNGLITCTGLGVFRFEQGNICTLNGNAILRGATRNNTLIRIANGAMINLSNPFNLRVEKATILRESGTSSARHIWLRNGATFSASDVIFDGQTDVADQAAFIDVK
jgi:hypothetical protein